MPGLFAFRGNGQNGPIRCVHHQSVIASTYTARAPFVPPPKAQSMPIQQFLKPLIASVLVLSLAACNNQQKSAELPLDNKAPVAVDDAASTLEDTALEIAVLANDSDPNGATDIDPGSLSFTAVSNGSVVRSGARAVFTPSPNFNGTASFRYTVKDRSGLAANAATVTITVQPVSDAPIAVNDTSETAEDTLVMVALLANDRDPDGAAQLNAVTLTFANVRNGTVARSGEQAAFTPAANFNGTASFDYTVADAGGLSSNTATVTIVISPVNDTPTASDDAASTAEDTAATIAILTNDSDPDGAADLDPASLAFTDVVNGSVARNGQQAVFTPVANFNGTGSFRYTVKDRAGAASNAAAVTITVLAVNDAPVAVNDSASTAQDKPVTIAVLGNDRDPDTDGSLDPTSLVFSSAVNGSVVRNGSDAVFTPTSGFSGTASFGYTVKDGSGATSNLASVAVTVSPPPIPEPVGSCAPDNTGWESFSHLLGAIHEHSGYSDGTVATTPADYFTQGKSLGLDFMGSSDHSDNLGVPVTASGDCASPDLLDCVQPLPTALTPTAPIAKWDLTQQQAQAASGPGFGAFRGFEWTSDRFGHINVFFSSNNYNAKTTEGYAVSMESFWTWLNTSPSTLGGKDGLMVFNHPGREDQLHQYLPDPAYAFNDFEYRQPVDLRVVGTEVFGKSDQTYETDNGAPTKGWYAHALDKGWHVGAIGSEDEHGREWGKPTRAKTVLIARDRTVAALREAMLARRFYALAQNGNALRMTFTAAGMPMGSRLSPLRNSLVPLLVEVRGTAFNGTLELVGNGGALIFSAKGPRLEHTVRADSAESWYFVRVREGDANSKPIAYSSPIWINAGGGYLPCTE